MLVNRDENFDFGFRLILFVILLFVPGCSAKNLGMVGPATGHIFKIEELEDNSKSRVYIYRPNRFKGGGSAPWIYVNGERVFLLRNNGYSYITLKPGKYMFEVKKSYAYIAEEMAFGIFAESGKTYFLKVSQDHPRSFSSYMIGMVNQAQALEEIKRSRFITPENKKEEE